MIVFRPGGGFWGSMQPFTLSLFLSVLLAAPALAGEGFSQEDEFFSLERASLEEVLNIRTSVATRSGMSLRETPGLVTVITREEIQALGALSLADVLRTVPEFEFGVDVQGNLGLGVRGIWGNEGKVLLMWDGLVYNETLYSTLQFDRFPVDQIAEIEIIKGPGAAVYGGFAELAVINIKTRSARELRGSSAYAAAGTGGSAARYAGYSYGRTFRKGEISAQAHLGGSRRSGGRYSDFSGASYDMGGNSDLRPRSLNLQGRYKATGARLVLDDFSMRERDHFSALISSGSARLGFRALFAELKTAVRLSGPLRLEPSVSYLSARPWREDDEIFPYSKRTSRLALGVTAFYDPNSLATFLAGGEYYNDAAVIGAGTNPAAQYADGRGSVRYDNHAFFAQGSADLRIARLTAGARYDRHSQYGASLVPRVALTRVAGDFNLKALYSRAFRAPSIENIRLNPAIDPERSVSAEMEAGYKASEELFVSASVFHTTIKDPIVFTVAGGAETYANYDRTGTRGAGASVKFKRGALRGDLGYLYQDTQCNRVALYAVPGSEHYLLAFPRHKVTLSGSLPLASGLTLNPSAAYVSKRYGYYAAGAVKPFGERASADLNARLKGRPLPGLALTLGLRDVFNSAPAYIQPYDGGHAPLPAPGRELFLKAAYEF